MTRNQFKVFTWLLSRCSGRREIKCSARRLALKFNFSDAYAARLLKRMEEQELLEILRRGVGQRANLYRLERINLSMVVVPRNKKVKSTKLRPEDLPIRPISPFRGFRSTIESNAHARPGATRLTILSTIPRPTKPAKQPSSPFRRFASRATDPTKWNAQDIVCYYVLLFRHEYGREPVINWQMDTVAGRNLLKRFTDLGYDPPAPAVKYFLQLAFGTSKDGFTPHSLGVFTQAWLIDKVVDRWEDQDVTWGYRDKVILKEVV